MKDDAKLQELKLLYEENGTQFRFFLTWRQLLLAGYFAIIAALAIAFKWLLAEAHMYIFVCPFLGAGISALFWALDHRNRQLYKLSSAVGSALEEKLGYKGLGHYGKYAESDRSKVRHGVVLATFYIVSGALMLVIGILSLLMDLSVTISPAGK